MHSALILEPLPDASPVEELRARFRAADFEVARTRERAIMEAAETRGGLILRVVPHLDQDDCGFAAPHGAYSVNYAVPMLCPTIHGTGLTPAELWRSCLDCWEQQTTGAEIRPGVLHAALWDVTKPVTFRLNESGHNKWDDLVFQIYEWENDLPQVELSAEQALAVAGVERRMQLNVLSHADARTREHMVIAQRNGASVARLAELSGLSRRSVPNWTRTG